MNIFHIKIQKENIPIGSILSPILGFIVCITIIIFCGKNPLQALSSLFSGTFTSLWYFGTMLNTATFLMTAGAGSAIALKSGNMNLGGEGQIYLGGYISALVLTSPLRIVWPLKFILALILTLMFGALVAIVSAFLYELRGATVLLTSFLLSAALIPIIDSLILSANSSSGQNLLAFPYIDEKFRFYQLLPPSPFCFSFFIAIAICVITYFFMKHTYMGRTMEIWGKAPEFAKYCGYSSIANSFVSLALSGALHSLTGMFAVCGTYYTCHKGFYSGMGWNALSAALIVSANPLALIPASIVLAWLYTSAERVGLTQGFAFDISGIVQGCILFAIAIPFSLTKKPFRK